MKVLLTFAGSVLIIVLGVFYYLDNKNVSVKKQMTEKPNVVIVDDEPKSSNKKFVIPIEIDKSEDRIQASAPTKTIIKLNKQQSKINIEEEAKKAKEKMLASSKKQQTNINSKVKKLEQDLHNKALKTDLVDDLKNASSYREAILDKAKQEIN